MDLTKTKIGKITFNQALEIVMNEFNISQKTELNLESLRSDTKSIYISYCRLTMFYLVRKYCPEIYYKDIGVFFNRYDHSTIIRGIQKIDSIIQGNPARKGSFKGKIASRIVLSALDKINRLQNN